MRLFLGLPVPADLATTLVRLARSVTLPDPRWAPPENVHLTLVFLGSVGEEKLVSIVRELEALRRPRFRIRLTALGTFPRAGVLFADAQPTHELLDLQREVAERMEFCRRA